MVRTRGLEYLEDLGFDQTGVLHAALNEIHSTYHTTLKASAGKLVLGQYMISNIRHVDNWIIIRQQKQNIIHENNQQKNERIICHQYSKGEKKILHNHQKNNNEKPYNVPYKIIELLIQYRNVMIQKGPIYERIKIRIFLPFRQQYITNM